MCSTHRCREVKGLFYSALQVREQIFRLVLADKGRLDLSLEALAVSKQFTALFSDEEANNALNRLLDAGYRF